MKVIVVGGGWAGVSAAVRLAEAGHRVELHETRGSLGGRAYHVGAPPGFPAPIDNGPHLFLGAYSETLDLLKTLGRPDPFHWVDPMELAWLLPGGRRVSLRSGPFPAPFHLAWGLLVSDAFAWKDKLHLAFSLAHLGGLKNPQGTVEEFMDLRGAGPDARERFWGPLTRAIVNMPPGKAPLKSLVEVFRRVFFGSRRASTLAFPRVPLGEMLGDSVEAFLRPRGGRVALRSGVASLERSPQGVASALSAEGETLQADAWVFAVPPDRISQLFPGVPWAQVLPALGKSPIVTAHLVLDRRVLEGHQVGLSGATFEWVFNRNRNWDLEGERQVLSFVSSADEGTARSGEKDLVDLAYKELCDRLPRAGDAKVLAGRVIREGAATFAWTLESDRLRPAPRTPLRGVFLAGDWTDTGLPATIEGAVLSGRRAAEALGPGPAAV